MRDVNSDSRDGLNDALFIWSLGTLAKGAERNPRLRRDIKIAFTPLLLVVVGLPVAIVFGAVRNAAAKAIQQTGAGRILTSSTLVSASIIVVVLLALIAVHRTLTIRRGTPAPAYDRRLGRTLAVLAIAAFSAGPIWLAIRNGCFIKAVGITGVVSASLFGVLRSWAWLDRRCRVATAEAMKAVVIVLAVLIAGSVSVVIAIL